VGVTVVSVERNRINLVHVQHEAQVTRVDMHVLSCCRRHVSFQSEYKRNTLVNIQVTSAGMKLHQARVTNLRQVVSVTNLRQVVSVTNLRQVVRVTNLRQVVRVTNLRQVVRVTNLRQVVWIQLILLHV